MSDADSTRHVSPFDFSKRQFKPNPMNKSKEERRAQRRGWFLKRVAEGREEKQWEERSEQILRSDYFSDRRRWEDEQRRSTDVFASELEDENDLPMPDQGSFGVVVSSDQQQDAEPTSTNPDDEVEAIVRMEEQELDALLALTQDDYVPPNPPSERYGSDEEDWESLFMECVSFSDSNCQANQQKSSEENDEMEIG